MASGLAAWRFEKIHSDRDELLRLRSKLAKERTCVWSGDGVFFYYEHMKEIAEIDEKLKALDAVIPLLRPKLRRSSCA